MSNTAIGIEGILNLIELTAGASQNRCSTKFGLESAGDGRVGVGLARAGGNAGVGKPLWVFLAGDRPLEMRNAYLIGG